MYLSYCSTHFDVPIFILGTSYMYYSELKTNKINLPVNVLDAILNTIAVRKSLLKLSGISAFVSFTYSYKQDNLGST